MDTKRVVMALGHRFRNLDRERQVLEPYGAEVIDGKSWSPEEAARHAEAADAILVGAVLPVNAAFIRHLKRCRIIVRYGIGLDNVDVEAAKEAGIAVSNVTEYCTEEVSNHAVALILAMHRRLTELNERARTGRWVFSDLYVPRLSRTTLGLVGSGRIGREVCRKALALGMTVRIYDPYVDFETIQRLGATPASLETLLAESDFISLHAPLTPETFHVLDARRLALLKPSAVLVNVARGALVDEQALLEALEGDRIGGAALDVLEHEPMASDHPLKAFPNVLLTPHAAWYSEGAGEDLQIQAAEKVAHVLFHTGGKP